MFSKFTDHKLPIFPLIKLSKKPSRNATEWSKLHYFDNDSFEEEIAESSGFGVVLTEDWVVIDYDKYKTGADESLEKLIALGLDLQTFTVESARGGYHFYYRNPTKQRIIKNDNNYPGIDFLSVGCYTVGPGTATKDGLYTIMSGSLDTALDIPPAVLLVLEKSQAVLSNTTINIDSETEYARFVQYLETQEGAEQGNRGYSTYKLAAKARDFGLSEVQAFEALLGWDEKCLPPAGNAEITLAVNHAYKYAKNEAGVAAVNVALFADNAGAHNVDTMGSTIDGWDIDAKGKMRPTGRNLINILSLEDIQGRSDSFYNLFKYNENEQAVEFTRKPFWRNFRDVSPLFLNDMDLLLIKAFLATHYSLDFPTDTIHGSVRSTAYLKAYHPIKHWLENLEWDGKPRLGDLFNGYFNNVEKSKADNHYRSAVARAFVLAAIYRIFQPGYKWDAMLVLCGSQGVGKSIFVEIMGGGYSKVMYRMGTDVKTLECMQGGWFLEFPELSAAKKSDINDIKAFITTTADTFRKAYGHVAQTIQRQSVFVWTLNPTQEGFLRDETGNRRFLIVDTDQHIDLTGIKRDREQLFAEGMELFKKGIEPLTFLNELPVQEIAKEYQAENQVDTSDLWAETIKEWLEKADIEFGQYKHHRTVGTLQILEDALMITDRTRHDRRAKLRMAFAMRELGWKPRKSNGKYFYYDLNSDLYNI